MAFDYKKEYKEFYLPKAVPGIVTVPEMNYIAVRGQGDPNTEGGAYQASIELLYGIAFTIKMSKRGSHRIAGYFDYVVPPLEGFWWQDGRYPADAALQSDRVGRQDGMIQGIDYAHKENFRWISLIRLPEFVTKEELDWAVSEASAKKKQDFSKVEFLTYDEDLCVQCMHIGSYDEEPETVNAMHRYMEAQGYVPDITDQRFHHEIYLSDARRCAPEKLRTVIRLPIRKMGN